MEPLQSALADIDRTDIHIGSLDNYRPCVGSPNRRAWVNPPGISVLKISQIQC